MSHQFYTYITPTDYAEIQNLLSKEFQISYYKTGDFRMGKHKTLEKIESLVIKSMGHEDLTVHFIEKGTEETLGNSIECSRSYLDSDVFRRGRFYYDNKYLDENNMISFKNQAFLSWAKGVFIFLKKHLIYNTEVECYFGTEAASLYKVRPEIFKSNFD